MNICQWESCVQSGCCVCLRLIKNNNVSTIQSIVLQWFQRNKKEFLHKYVTMDETWIHHFTQESNCRSAGWTAGRWKPSKATKTQTSAGKVLASVFWDAQGILFISYLKKGRTINSKYHIALLVHLKEEIVIKRPQMKRKKCSFTKTRHCVTSRSQRWQNYMNCPSNCFHTHPILQIWPPATTGYLQALKECSRGKRFGSNEEVISETEAYFEAKNKSFYKKGIELLEKCWNQCITLQGDYVDE